MLNIPNWLAAVHHDGSLDYVSNPYPQLGEKIRLSLRTGSDAPLKRIFLRTFPDGEQALSLMKPGQMVQAGSLVAR